MVSRRHCLFEEASITELTSSMAACANESKVGTRWFGMEISSEQEAGKVVFSLAIFSPKKFRNSAAGDEESE